MMMASPENDEMRTMINGEYETVEAGNGRG
jgi:hypothetical protein